MCFRGLKPIGLGLGGVVVAGLAWVGVSGGDEGASGAPAAQPGRVASAPEPVPVAETARRHPEASATAGPASEPGAITLAARVRHLAQSPDPQDALRAYALLRGCRGARQSEQIFRMTKLAERDATDVRLAQAGFYTQQVDKACGDLTSRDLAGRLALVERAAEAGVHGAAIHMANEGPWGEPEALATRWDDPLVQAWRARVIGLIVRAAEQGDLLALASLAAQYASGDGLVAEHRPELALRYTVAHHALYEATRGRAVLGGEREARELAAQLPREVADRAREAGLQLARSVLKEK